LLNPGRIGTFQPRSANVIQVGLAPFGELIRKRETIEMIEKDELVILKSSIKNARLG
jgi:hypothetical protein